MVEPLRTVLDRDEDAGVYKPLALLSVAAFAVAAFFCGLVVILTIVGLVTRRPVLEPWLIALAVAGVLLAIAARWQIALSEGTRGGSRLAAIGWWLSVVGGCVYAAYYGGNVLAIQRQAAGFVEEAFFTPLKSGEIEKAYYYTIEPDRRKGMLVSDIPKRFGDVFTPFKNDRLQRQLIRGKEAATFESLGTASWKQGPEGLEVVTRHLLHTPEGDFEALVPILGTENRETGQRDWHIKQRAVLAAPLFLTNYGRAVERLQQEADQFLTDWAHQLRMGPSQVEAFLATEPLTREERKTKFIVFFASTLGGSIITDVMGYPYGVHVPFKAMATFRTDAAAEAWFPKLKERSRIVKWDDSRQKQPKSALEQMLPQILEPGYINPGQAQGSDVSSVLEISPTLVRATLSLEVTLPAPLRYRCTGKVVAVCEDAKFLNEVKRLADQPRAEGAVATIQALWRDVPHNWRVTEVIIDLAKDANDMRPAAPMGGPNAPMRPH